MTPIFAKMYLALSFVILLSHKKRKKKTFSILTCPNITDLPKNCGVKQTKQTLRLFRDHLVREFNETKLTSKKSLNRDHCGFRDNTKSEHALFGIYLQSLYLWLITTELRLTQIYIFQTFFV